MIAIRISESLFLLFAPIIKLFHSSVKMTGWHQTEKLNAPSSWWKKSDSRLARSNLWNPQNHPTHNMKHKHHPNWWNISNMQPQLCSQDAAKAAQAAQSSPENTE